MRAPIRNFRVHLTTIVAASNQLRINRAIKGSLIQAIRFNLNLRTINTKFMFKRIGCCYPMAFVRRTLRTFLKLETCGHNITSSDKNLPLATDCSILPTPYKAQALFYR